MSDVPLRLPLRKRAVVNVDTTKVSSLKREYARILFALADVTVRGAHPISSITADIRNMMMTIWILNRYVSKRFLEDDLNIGVSVVYSSQSNIHPYKPSYKISHDVVLFASRIAV